MSNANKTVGPTAKSVRKLNYSALFLALTLVLPFLTGQVPEIGTMFGLMHMPVLLCGFACNWQWGLAVGLVAPLMRSVLFSTPPMLMAIPMTFELATYGFIAGLLYKKLPKSIISVYLSLISAMIAGRIVWGLASWLMAGLQNTAFSFKMFISGAVTSAIPGIVLHIVLIPLLVISVERSKIMLKKRVEEG